MSNNKKTLLSEAQIRQFMKLAKLEPLSPGFVEGLTSLTEEEGSKWKDGEHEYKRRDKKGKVGKRAGVVDGHYKTGETNESAEATDELVEAITKRVAARILKSALAKK